MKGGIVTGRFRSRILGPDGRVVRGWRPFPNGTTYQGVNAGLEALFRLGSQPANWYAGLVSGSGFTAVSTADTAASHAGWTEQTDYSAATRPAWAPVAAVSGVLRVSAPISLTCNAVGGMTVAGIFLVTSSVKGGTAGILYSTGLEASVQTVANGQVYQFLYSIHSTPGG